MDRTSFVESIVNTFTLLHSEGVLVCSEDCVRKGSEDILYWCIMSELR